MDYPEDPLTFSKEIVIAEEWFWSGDVLQYARKSKSCACNIKWFTFQLQTALTGLQFL